jgi:hypothetical protein
MKEEFHFFKYLNLCLKIIFVLKPEISKIFKIVKELMLRAFFIDDYYIYMTQKNQKSGLGEKKLTNYININ